MRLSKTKKHVSRAYGGSMCAKCVRDRWDDCFLPSSTMSRQETPTRLVLMKSKICFHLLFPGSSVLSWLRSRRSLSKCWRHRHRARNRSKMCISIATIKTKWPTNPFLLAICDYNLFSERCSWSHLPPHSKLLVIIYAKFLTDLRFCLLLPYIRKVTNLSKVTTGLVLF